MNNGEVIYEGMPRLFEDKTYYNLEIKDESTRNMVLHYITSLQLWGDSVAPFTDDKNIIEIYPNELESLEENQELLGITLLPKEKVEND